MRFHFAATPVHGGADAEQALNAFLGSHRVLHIERHLIADSAQSVRAICVSYTDATSPTPTGPVASRGGPGRKERIDHREILDEAAFARFAKLRAWRKLAAGRDGVPLLRLREPIDA
jgi:hypothetical protein